MRARWTVVGGSTLVVALCWAWVIAMALDMRGRAQLLTLFFPVSRSDPHLMR